MLIRSISGVRGITATHLTPEVVEQVARAFHRFLPKGVIILGRDSRPSGELIVDRLVSVLSQYGRDIVYCGIVPTPTVQFAVERSDAIAGIVVTASHNPSEWNGLKFIRTSGTFFLPDECKTLFNLADKKLRLRADQNPGMTVQDVNIIQKHILHNLSLKCIDFNLIRKKKFRVVIDAVNGAGSDALPDMLSALGCEVVRLHCEPNGDFSRGTEPLPENLSDLSKAVVKEKAHVGFAVDPDADRLAIVDEKGSPLGEEYTLVMALDGYCHSLKTPETFVTNMSSSMALDRTAEKYGCTVERAAVGEINVVQTMNRIGARFGGEGNGGVILREAHLGRDSLVGVTMILHRLALSEKTVSEVHDSLPRFHMVKDRVQLDDRNPDERIGKVEKMINDAEISRLDGLKFSWEDRWLHLRKSNTEPIIRIYAESPSERSSRELVDRVKRWILD